MRRVGEYLNLLDVTDPVAPARRRERDPALLGSAEKLAQVGLTSRRLGAGRATDAAADWPAAQDLLAVGNEASAKFHLKRAREVDAELVRTLDKARSSEGTDPRRAGS